jgi:hypothetical protein
VKTPNFEVKRNKYFDVFYRRERGMPEDPARIKRALDIANRYGGYDGGHHKSWVIDQMVRALLGCPDVEKMGGSGRAKYSYITQGESKEYLDWVHQYEYEETDDDGEPEYEWDVGVPP